MVSSTGSTSDVVASGISSGGRVARGGNTFRGSGVAPGAVPRALRSAGHSGSPGASRSQVGNSGDTGFGVENEESSSVINQDSS